MTFNVYCCSELTMIYQGGYVQNNSLLSHIKSNEYELTLNHSCISQRYLHSSSSQPFDTEIFNSKFWIFQPTSDGNMTSTKVVALNEIWN